MPLLRSQKITPELRSEFVAQQSRYLDDIFSLASDELAKKEEFYRLAIDTFDTLVRIPFKLVSTFPFAIAPRYRVFEDYREHELPDFLLDRWRDWERDYPALVERNPKLALREIIRDCSETHDFCGWPNFPWEADILHWIDTGHWEKPPFDDRKGIMNEEFFSRLRQLRDQCQGWLFWDEAEKRVVFVPLTEARRKALFLRPRKG